MKGPSPGTTTTPVALGNGGQYAFKVGKCKRTMSKLFEHATFTVAADATI